MTALLHKVYNLLVAYGPVGVFLLSIIDSMGVPLPAAMDALVLTVAAGSTRAPSHAYFTALLAVLGSTGGNIFLFHAAQQGGRLFRRQEQPRKPQRFRRWFQRYGLATVFVPAVVPIVPLPLKVFVISAGALHTPFLKFVVVILVARAIRYFGLAYLGLLLGSSAEGFLRQHGWFLGAALLVVMAGAYLGVRYYGNRQDSTMS
jgi:membrane protein DedA with SNARE-associated domain